MTYGSYYHSVERGSMGRRTNGGHTMNNLLGELRCAVLSLKEIRTHYEAAIELPESRKRNPDIVLDKIHDSLAFRHRTIMAEKEAENQAQENDDTTEG